ncbi:MAG: hypothetical protein Q8O58_01295, partial [Gallionella sp.]|nr:hypothetical protein [Gallionella sp.]
YQDTRYEILRFALCLSPLHSLPQIAYLRLKSSIFHIILRQARTNRALHPVFSGAGQQSFAFGFSQRLNSPACAAFVQSRLSAG